MHWYGWEGMGAFGWVGMLLMMLFWFGLIAFVIWAVASLLTRGQQSPGQEITREDRAIGILRERYARGEINEQEFNDARRTLESTVH